MHRRSFLKAGLAVGGVALIGTAGAQERDYRPGGPWAPTERAVNYDAYLTNEELGDRLERIDRRSDRIELRNLGESAGRGDPLWEVTVGNGDESIHIINQIHGDEPAGAEAVVQILNRLATGNSPQVEKILDNVTITMMPRTNPDGSNFVGEDGLGDDGELRHRRTNTIEWEEGDSRYINANNYYYWLDAPGYDLNRGFNIDPDYEPWDEPDDWWTPHDDLDGYGFLDVPVDAVDLDVNDPVDGENPYDVLWGSGQNLNPENVAMTESFLDADPDWAITHHHQGANVVPENGGGGGGPKWQTVMSVMAPYGPTHIRPDEYDYAGYVAQGNPYMSIEAQERSLKLNVLVKDQMEKFGRGKFNTITRFPYGPLWGSYLDTLPLQTDAAGILYEVSHQSEDRGQMALGTMVKVTVEGFMATFERVADGSIHGLDKWDYFEMPIREGISNPHEGRGIPVQ